MSITLVQAKSATGTSGSPSLTLSSASTAGNLLVAFCDTGQNSGNPTLTPPASWTAETELVNQTFVFRNGLVAYYANNPGGISTITITASPVVSGGGWCLYVLEFSGVATSSPTDGEAQKVNASGGGLASPSENISTTVDGDLVLGWAAGDAANGASSVTGPSSPWTNETQIADVDGFERAICGYQVQTTHGSITYQPTFASATDYIIAIIAFKAAGGGGIVSGSGSFVANAVLAESAATLIAGGEALAASAVLSESAATLIVSGDALQANADLSASAATLIASGDTLQANAALSESATLIAHSAVLQANGALAQAGAQVVSEGAAVASALLAQSQAQLVIPATLAASAALAQAQALIDADGLALVGNGLFTQAPPVGIIANAALVVAAQIVAGASPLVADGALTLAGAQITYPSAALAASALLTQSAAQVSAQSAALQANALLALAILRPTQPPAGVSAAIGAQPIGISASASMQPLGVSATLEG